MDASAHVIEFDEFALDLHRLELRHLGTRVPVERQVFDLLAYLVRAEGRIVPKEELLDNVWGTRFVTESALTTQIKFARRALGDDGRRQRFIRTVHRRGYEFVGRPAPDESRRRPPPTPGDRTGRPLADQAAAHLIGRDGALADVVDELSSHRLVTVAGPGGVGKTQLALAVAATVADQHADGVVQVDLAAVTEPEEISSAVAEAAGLGLREGVAVADALAESRALVLIDNCEHLVDHVATFVERLLAQPHDPVRVLTTSREALAVEGERVYLLDPLPVHGSPGQPSAAARLFARRAGRPLDDELAGVEELVALLDGLPLAIELAAAQLGFMGLPELHRRLAAHRLSLEHRRRSPARHDSLAESVDWSWRLLDQTERTMLTELSAFPADFGLDAVERLATTADPISVLRDLHAKSLVASAQADGSTRFRLLFGVRAFVRPHQAALVDGTAGLRRRLATACAEWLDEWTFEEQWTSSEFLDVVLAERATIREIGTTSDPTVATEVARVVATSAALHRHGIAVSHGRAMATSADLDALPDDVAARLALAGSEASYAFGDVDAKDRLSAAAYGRAIAAGRDDLASVARSQQCIGRMLDEPERCMSLLDEALHRARRAARPRIESIALGLQAFCRLVDRSTRADARPLLDQAERLAAPSGWDRTSATTVRAISQFLLDDRPGAAAEFASLAATMRSTGLHAAAALFQLLETTCCADVASPAEIRAAVEAFLFEYRRATGHAGRADALLLFAHRAVLIGDEARASALLGALAGRRLAHQGSMLILDHVARRAGVPEVALGVPSVVSPQSVPLLAQLLDEELAGLR